MIISTPKPSRKPNEGDIKNLLEDLAGASRNLTEYAQKMGAVASHLQTEAPRYNDPETNLAFTTKELDEVFAFYGTLDTLFADFANSYADLTLMQAYYSRAVLPEGCRFSPEIEGCHMVYSEGKIMFRMPTLPTRNHAKFIAPAASKIPPYYKTILALLGDLLEQKAFDPMAFSHKEIVYFFVYDPAKKFAADADNVDTKYVTDALVLTLPNGDAPGYCDFRYASRYSDLIESGVYAVVIPAEKKHRLSNDEVFDFIVNTERQYQRILTPSKPRPMMKPPARDRIGARAQSSSGEEENR